MRWVFGWLLTLDKLGINITALVAGLGSGGIAIALAVQNAPGDPLAIVKLTAICHAPRDLLSRAGAGECDPVPAQRHALG
jgi:hypothetical protein